MFLDTLALPCPPALHPTTASYTIPAVKVTNKRSTVKQDAEPQNPVPDTRNMKKCHSCLLHVQDIHKPSTNPMQIEPMKEAVKTPGQSPHSMPIKSMPT
jgi:hypothetical protein